ncbi:MAG: hypothetical protein KatS3mg081_0885 [Gemmatimonadales bacterium]|nr:MAG: hypothetical protein KatS3mg081_0885 [Gemmatimonadales bacterium]
MSDSLYRDIPMEHVSRYPVMGIMTTFLSNSARAMALIRHTYSDWLKLQASASEIAAGPQVRVIVHDPVPPRNLGALHFRAPDPGRLFISASPCVGVADALRLDGCAYVTADILSEPEVFAEGVLEPLTLTLLASLDREPLHASAVVRDGVAVVLAGPSGSGKSTLAYAAHRRGYFLLADESVHVQLRPHLRVWGLRGRIKLPEAAKAYFPELKNCGPGRLFSGKTKIAIGVPEERRCFFSDKVALCILGGFRRGGPRATPLLPEEAVARLASQVEEGFDLYRSSAPQRIRTLAQAGAWLLEPGERPEETVSLFDDLVGAVH